MRSHTEGRVLFGINNIYAVVLGREAAPDSTAVRCRIKGKVLQGSKGEYSPLAPGDIVRIQESGNEGLILDRLPRRNSISRWNRKRHRLQVLGSNIDHVLVIASTGTPPFRPRFVDRALALCEHEGIAGSVVVNKIDLGVDDTTAERLKTYRRLAYEVLETSAKEGIGLDRIRSLFSSGGVLLLGHSGVGKSSLVNRLLPTANQPVGEVSHKHRRGRHTTNFAVLHPGDGGALIDTPGIRELDLYPLTCLEIAHGYREIRMHAAGCAYPNCTHLHEPDCAVQAAVKRGDIDTDRYQSYGYAVADRDHTASIEEP